jgi:HEAT repeat protein
MLIGPLRLRRIPLRLLAPFPRPEAVVRRATIAATLLVALTPGLPTVAQTVSAPPRATSNRHSPGAIPSGYRPLDRTPPPPTPAEFSDARLFELLAEPTWVDAARPDSSDPLDPPLPWRHAAADELLARARLDPDRIPTLRRLAHTTLKAAPDDRHALASAVLLASLSDRPAAMEVFDRLVAGADGEERSRAIAAFMLARLSPSAVDPAIMERLLARRAAGLRPRSPRGVPEATDGQATRPPAPLSTPTDPLSLALRMLHARAVAADPAFDPGSIRLVINGLRSPHASERAIALLAFARPLATRGGRSEHSDRGSDLVTPLLADPDPSVRRTALAVMEVRSPGPTAVAVCLKALADREPSVVELAAERLTRRRAESGSATPPGMKEAIEGAWPGASPRARAALVPLAVQADATGTLRAAAADPTQAVRLALAERIDALPDSSREKLAAGLLCDRSPSVQAAAIRAVGRLPEPQAVPSLLGVLESPSLSARRSAVAGLARFDPEARQFDPDAPERTRRSTIRELRARWARRMPEAFAERTGLAESSVARSRGTEGRPGERADPRADLEGDGRRTRESDATRHDRERAARALELLAQWNRPGSDRAGLTRQFSGLGSAGDLDGALAESPDAVEPELLERVLEPADPRWSSIRALLGPGNARRGAVVGRAAELLETGATGGMKAAVADHLIAGAEPSAWIRLYPHLDGLDPRRAERLRRVGLAHAEPSVRRLVLERAKSERAPLDPTIPALLGREADSLVRLAGWAAVEASAAPEPGLELARVPPPANARERLALARARLACGLNDWAELHRLVHHAEPSIRAETVKAAGDLAVRGPAEARRLLLAGLDDRSSQVQRQAIAALESRTRNSYQSDGGGRPVPLDQQVDRWRRTLSGASSFLAD